MIELKHVNIKRRFDVLIDANFKFEEGNVYGIFAPNGSGKTTLFRAIMDLIPYEGIIDNGENNKLIKKDLFYFEDNNWFDENLTGKDYLKFVKSMWNSQIDITKIISIFNLESFVDTPIKKYSLGMKQRIILGMYFISDAKILIMDEITNGLDKESRTIFFTELQKIKTKKLILISSHYSEDIQDLIDKRVELNDQKIVEVTN